MIELDTYYTYHEVAKLIDRYGAEGFLTRFNSAFPKQAQALSGAVLHEHANDYDNKKAALLRRKE